MTVAAIAARFSVNEKTASRWLVAAGIERRRAGVRAGTVFRADHPGDDRLREMYESQRMSIRAMSRDLGVEASTLRAWIVRAGIRRRSISDAKQGQAPTRAVIEAMVTKRRKRIRDGVPPIGYKIRSDGYVQVSRPDHQNATKDGYILEHRLVMSEHLGRALRDDEDVHHKNGDRADNRLENLEIKTHSDHLREHYAEREIDPTNGRFMPRGAGVR